MKSLLSSLLSLPALFVCSSAFAAGMPCTWHGSQESRGPNYECIIVNVRAGYIRRIREAWADSGEVVYRTVDNKPLRAGSILVDDTGYPGKSVLQYIGPDKVVIRIKGAKPGVVLYR